MSNLDDIEFGEDEAPRIGRLRVTVANYDCYSQLWLSVLLRAVEDASLVLGEAKMHIHNLGCKRVRGHIVCDKRLPSEDHIAQKSAREWFVSASTSTGSLLWICSTLDIDVEVIRRELRKRVEANLEDARLGRTGANRTYPRAVLHHRTPGRAHTSGDAHHIDGQPDETSAA